MSLSAKKNVFGMMKLAGVVLVVTLGIWGCARKPADANGERVRTLEARCAKLEQDYRTVAQARDRARKDLTALEEENARLKSESTERESLVKERDEAVSRQEKASSQLYKRTAERDQLIRDLHVRTAERDTALNRYEKLRKTLQTIVAQDEGAQQQQNTDTPLAGPVIGGNS